MAESNSRNTKLNRRQAMLLPGAAGLGGALALPAAAAETNNTPRQAAGQLLDSSYGRREDAVWQGARVCRVRRPDV